MTTLAPMFIAKFAVTAVTSVCLLYATAVPSEVQISTARDPKDNSIIISDKSMSKKIAAKNLGLSLDDLEEQLDLLENPGEPPMPLTVDEKIDKILKEIKEIKDNQYIEFKGFTLPVKNLVLLGTGSASTGIISLALYGLHALFT